MRDPSGRRTRAGRRRSSAGRRKSSAGLWLVLLLIASGGVATSDAAKRLERRLIPAAANIELPEYALEHAPYRDGERLEYEFGWQGIPAATASVEVSEVERDGERRVRIVGWARTKRVVDLVWKMRDRAETLIDPETGVPERFVFKQRENRNRIDTDLTFDWDEGVAVGKRTKNGNMREREFPVTRAYDPISAAFMMRGLDLEVGDEKVAEILNGKSRYVIRMKVAARETLELGGRSYEAFRLEPRIGKVEDGQLADHHEKVKKATIWISADPPRQLLRLESEVLWGYVYGEWLPPAQPQQAKAGGGAG